jgi:hypothetical protein
MVMHQPSGTGILELGLAKFQMLFILQLIAILEIVEKEIRISTKALTIKIKLHNGTLSILVMLEQFVKLLLQLILRMAEKS